MKVRCENCNCQIEFLEISNQASHCPSCGSVVSYGDSGKKELAETVTVFSESKSNFLHFELLERLGFGHFGTVWKAHDTRLDRIVALKVPNSDGESKEQKLNFLREAQAAARLDHPNIIAIYEVGVGEEAYISTKFIDGTSLRDGMERFQGAYRKIAELMRDICRALVHSHEKGIVHRDLKPANILLDQEGKPYVADFGLAKQIGADVTIAKDGVILGTPAYMPPEQALGRTSEIDERSDLYSLGVILFELLSGERPYKANTQRALLYQIIHEEPIDPQKIKKEVPRDLANICLKLIEKQPARRYQGAKELLDDIERYLNGVSILARPWPWYRRTVRLLVRRKDWVIGTSFAAVLISVIAWASIPRKPDWWDSAPTILLDTYPQGAQAVFIPIDLTSGIPIPGKEIRLKGVSPFKTRVPRGNYRVTAWTDDQHFHEVLRTIPEDNGELPISESPNYWKITMDGDVRLPLIRIFDQAVVSKNFEAIPSGYVDVEDGRLESPGFLIAPKEVTVGDLNRNGIPLPMGMKMEKGRWQDDEFIGFIPYWQSMDLCEKLGWVPMLDVDYEYTMKTLIELSSLADLKISIGDNQQEWAGPCQFALGRFVARGSSNLPGMRSFLERHHNHPKLGFRGFRPTKPRIKASDFTQFKKSMGSM